MKIRTGFVSNSSSSSFVVLYHPVKFSELDADKDDNVHVIGDFLSEGQDYFKLTSEMIIALQVADAEGDHDFINYNTLVRPVLEFDGESDKEVDLSAINKIHVSAIQKDYWCTSTLDEFVERYLEAY